MTIITSRFSVQLADLRQLVLFPEVVGVRSLPLDQCNAVVSTPVREQEEDPHSLQQPLDAGQLLLFTDTIQQGIPS